MTQVRTRDEAIAAVDRALHEWERALTAVLTQASAVVDGARNEAQRVVSRCATRVSAIEAALSAADDRDRRRLETELVRARAKHDQARRAAVRITDVGTGVGQLNRSHVSGGVLRVTTARGQLAKISRAIEDYRQGAGIGVGAGIGTGSSASAAGPAVTAPPSFFGLGEVNVDAADLADTPLQGEFGRGGVSRADYRWAVQTWSDIVGPGVTRGMTRDDFVARDERYGAPPLRRTADVYDIFLGTDRIRVDRRVDGSLNIVNGRHRLLIARDLGIRSLPGQIS